MPDRPGGHAYHQTVSYTPAAGHGPGSRLQRQLGEAARRRLLAALAVASVAGTLAVAIADASSHQIDFDIYRMGGANFLGAHLYDLRLPRALMPGGQRGMHFTYPPFAALLFWPFAQLPVYAGQVIWALINVLLLGVLVAVSIRLVRPQWPTRRLLTVSAIAMFPAVRLSPDGLTLTLGQVNVLIAVLVLADLGFVLRAGQRTVPRGVLLGIAAAVKLTPLIFIPFLLLTRQFRAAAIAASAFAVCSLGLLALTPRSSAAYWTRYIFDSKRVGNMLYISDQNLHSALQRMLGGPVPATLLAAATLLFGIGGLAVATWAYRVSSPMLGILLCAATGLIVSPVSWSHHYVWVVPVLVWLALGPDRPRGGAWWALAVAVLFLADPIWQVPDQQSGYGGPLVLLTGNSYFLAAVAFLILAAVLLWRRQSAPGLANTHGPAQTPASQPAPEQLRHISPASQEVP
jgi:alpha-1,2-mannosyltransferase